MNHFAGDYWRASVTPMDMKPITGVVMCALPLLAGRAEIPEPVLPAGVGVNIHFVTGHEKDLDLIAAAGFKFVRMDFGWEAIETSKGEYNWAGYEELLTNLEKRGLRAIFILDYSHRLYEETATSPNPITGATHKTTASPQHPASIAAFASWAAASLEIARRDEPHIGLRHLAGRKLGLVLEVEGLAPVIAAQGQIENRGGGFHSWKCGQALSQLLKERDPAGGLGEFILPKRHGNGQDIPRIEAGIGALEIPE